MMIKFNGWITDESHACTYECVYARADFSFIIIFFFFFLIFFSLLSMKAYKRAFFLRRKKIYNKIHNKLKYESFFFRNEIFLLLNQQIVPSSHVCILTQVVVQFSEKKRKKRDFTGNS